MTPESIKGIMTVLNRHSATDTRIIVSVPNSGSFQFFIFKENFAYYDPQNHIQQFSVQSLNRLMDTYGFNHAVFLRQKYMHFRLPQGLLNTCNRIHNYFYQRRKRGLPVTGYPIKRFLLDGYNYMLVLLFLPVAGLLSVYDILFPHKGGVITICYRKRKIRCRCPCLQRGRMS